VKPFDKIRKWQAENNNQKPTVKDVRKILTEYEVKELQAEYYDFTNVLKALHNPHLPRIEAVQQNIVSEAQERILENKYRSTCSRKEQIQGFFRHTIDLDDLFRRHGNPPTLKMIAQPDTHAKFVNREAINAFIQFCHYYKAHVHMIMGDFADCEGVAHWEPDSMEPRRLVPEMKISRALLRRIVEAGPENQTRIFLEGNHEYWIQMFIKSHPEMFDGLEDLGLEISLRTLLDLDKFKFELFPLNHLVKIGRAHYTHGIYTVMHHAKKHLDIFKGNIYYGHLHDTQTHNQTSLDGHMEAGSLGCLCRLDAHFLKGKPNNWANAFGIFEFFPDGNYTHIKPTIFNGRFSYAGKIFDGNVSSDWGGPVLQPDQE
jgi:hypothetical protein